jgi:hypothetical protein
VRCEQKVGNTVTRLTQVERMHIERATGGWILDITYPQSVATWEKLVFPDARALVEYLDSLVPEIPVCEATRCVRRPCWIRKRR